MLIDFHFDFETRSHLNLKLVGTVNYALHTTTEATLLTWAMGRNSKLEYWHPGMPLPPVIIDVATNPDKYFFNAHNVFFDYLIWTVVMPRMFPTIAWKKPSIKNIHDNMALTSHHRVGASLEAAARILQLPATKDKEGRAIMLKQCKPNMKGVYPTLTKEEWEKFIRYGIQDTKLLRDIFYILPPLPEPERWAWEWTFKRNLMGLRLDMDLVRELSNIVETTTPRLLEEFSYLTGGIAPNSPIRCKNYFKNFYPEIEDMQAETLRDLLEDPREVPWYVRRCLEIKDLAGSTSIAKLKTAMNQAYASRVYGFLAYSHTQTKRWAGRGIQVQNFPRIDGKRPDKIDFDLNVTNLVDAVRAKRPELKDHLGFVKNLLRRIFIPDDGLYMYCGDWSKIEPTVLFWFVGLGPIPDKWYEEMAAAIYDKNVSDIGKDSFERQIGKMAALSCGYGSGWESFKKAVKKQAGIIIDDVLAKRTIKAYRAKYQVIDDFWYDLEKAFKLAVGSIEYVVDKQTGNHVPVKKPGIASSLCGGKLFVMPMEEPFKGVRIRLPSGGYLYYHHARITPPRTTEVFEDGKRAYNKDGTPKTKYVPEGIAYISDEDGTPTLKHIYGGLLCENVVSATAREIILPALWRLENAGFQILNLIHDEMWGQGQPGRDEEFERLMCVNPSWCPDMRITAGLTNGIRYLK